MKRQEIVGWTAFVLAAIVVAAAIPPIAARWRIVRVRGELKRFREALPTRHWDESMRAGDKNFTPAGIAASEKVLLEFLDRVDSSLGDERALGAAFEKAITAFDAIAAEHHDMIETGEREDLGAFFNGLADLLGLRYEDGDITWKWRKNW